MELYLDTADLDAIRELAVSLPLAGVTTNPSIVAGVGRPLESLLPELRKILGPQAKLFAQVMSRNATVMVEEAHALRDLDPNLVVKVPATPAGLSAIKQLKTIGVPSLGTAVYSPMQGLLAALAGAEYVAPYVNRLDANGGDGIALVQSLQKLLAMHAPHCQVLAASFRTPSQVLDCLLAGATSVTIPPDVARQMLSSPSVDAAIGRFEKDWEKAFGKAG